MYVGQKKVQLIRFTVKCNNVSDQQRQQQKGQQVKSTILFHFTLLLQITIITEL